MNGDPRVGDLDELESRIQVVTRRLNEAQVDRRTLFSAAGLLGVAALNLESINTRLDRIVNVSKSVASPVSAARQASTPAATPSDESPTVDPLATPNTRAVYRYLLSLQAASKVISGEHLVLRESYDPKTFPEIKKMTGKVPGIVGVDYFTWNDNHNSGYRMNTAVSNAVALAHWKAGGLVSMLSHVYNPLTGVAGASRAASFVSEAQARQMVVAGTRENKALNTLLDRIAVGIADLDASGVVVIWRPWHEWNFWWSTNAGLSRTTLRNLWRYTFTYMTGTKGLHNIIWAYEAKGEPGVYAADLYPGNDVVDVIAQSSYDGAGPGYTFPQYSEAVALGKPYMLGEYGAGSPASDREYNWTWLLSALRTNNPEIMGVIGWAGNYGLTAYPSSAKAYLNDPRVQNVGQINWRAFL